ncbi:AEC family transporter [Geothermobacter hydrogeniphilus]|uniref:AEC family transporter n=1 Tax=Geothermobacter hydrogeniphilus TaxID=1969733 RepID=A0A2K2H8K0_9BACT|nr:AEC family transporter [Geothermobacter hydrogeniphilus]PNU19646.1 AEC family transporter [Geothermobacter hydrogeniphilus]
MQLFIDIINIVLPVFLVIALGFFLRRIELIDAPFLATVNRLVYYVCLPLLLFYKIGTADFFANFNPILVLGCMVVAVVLFCVTYLAGGIIGLPAAARGVFSQGACRGNLAYMGLAMVLNAYGENGLTRAGILMGFLVPLYNLGSITVLTLPHRNNGGGLSLKSWLKQILLNPLIIASAAGILWSLAELPLPRLFVSTLHIATGMTLPLALMAIGGSFSLRRLRGDIRLASMAGLVKLLLMPALTALVLISLGIRGLDLAVGLLLSGAPAATANFIMAAELKGDAELAGTIVMHTTLLSMLSYTLMLIILHACGL